MPVNKNALIRYHILDERLSNYNKYYTNDDLQESLNEKLIDLGYKPIGRTQYFKDLDFMKSEAGWSVEIEHIKDGRKKFLRYADRNFSIKKSELNKSQKEALKEAITSLSCFKGLPQFEQLEEIIPLLSDKLGISEHRNKIIFMDENPDYTGLHFITPLYNTIKSKRALAINYKPFRSEQAHSFIFHPYILKQYNKRWFVFGYNASKKAIENLALDRIQDFKESALEYIESPIDDWEEDYFYDIIGVSRDDKKTIKTIRISVSPVSAPYISTKPLHPSQKKLVKNDKGWYDFTIKVIPNYEMHSLLRGFGDDLRYIVAK